MTHVGYGVMKDGKPAGVWPLPAAECQRVMDRYKSLQPTHHYVIVPVYVGGEIAAMPNLSGAVA